MKYEVGISVENTGKAAYTFFFYKKPIFFAWASIFLMIEIMMRFY